MKLYQINAPYFCCGFEVDNDIVIWAAPIINWIKGKSLQEVVRYCENKHWAVYQIGV